MCNRRGNLLDSDVDLISKFQTPQEGMRSIPYRLIEREAWVNWLTDFLPWMSMITLTFDDNKHQYAVSQENAKNYFRDLVRKLNVGVFGDHYTKKCHHSYFGYALGLEWQKRDVPHYHFLVDNYVCFDFIHRYWGNVHGFAHTAIVDNREGVVEYVSKYILKAGGYLELYKPKKQTVPMFKPLWWQEAESRAASFAACETLDSAVKH